MATTYIKKTKRKVIDNCNICLQSRKMTWDHVPPQGCSNHQRVEITSFFQRLSGKEVIDKPIFSQNGLKYRTICGECNSLLGSKYDDELNKLVKSVLSFVNSKLILPPVISLKVRPLPIIKSITGHILAAKREIDQVTYDKVYRAFVLDENFPVPDDLHLFYWLYPFDNTVVMRDFYMSTTRDGNFENVAAFQVLKFFPLAFLLTESTSYQGLPSLTRQKRIDMNTEIEIPIVFNQTRDRFWPETVDSTNVIFASKETANSVFVTGRRS